MQPLERSLRSSHEAFASGLAAKVRGVVAESWGRSLATGVAPDALCPPFVFEHDELTDYRAAHPLSAVFPLLYDVLGRAAEDCDSVMAVGDADGRLLWVSGRPAVLRRAESINFAEGAWWDESHAGTNAPGVALKLGEPVLIRSGEHYAVPVQRWSCAAAPIHDPVSNAILGVVDVTGSAEAGSPQSLAMVRSAARMAEAELGRLILLRSVGAARSPSTALKAALLGRPDCEVRVDGRTIRLSLRHSEILALLVDHPEGLTGEQLALEVYGEDVQGSTVRAEILRLRALLGEQVLGSRPLPTARPRRQRLVGRHGRSGQGIGALGAAALRRSVAPAVGGARRDHSSGSAGASDAAGGAVVPRSGSARRLDPNPLGRRRSRGLGTARSAAAGHLSAARDGSRRGRPAARRVRPRPNLSRPGRGVLVRPMGVVTLRRPSRDHSGRSLHLIRYEHLRHRGRGCVAFPL